jgi:hypothetical protein
MIDAQRPVAIRALPDLCVGIIFQLVTCACQPTWCRWQVPARRVRVGRLGNASCLRFASMVRGDFGGSSYRAARSHE